MEEKIEPQADEVLIETKVEPAAEVIAEPAAPPGEVQINTGQPSDENSGGFFAAQMQEKVSEPAAQAEAQAENAQPEMPETQEAPQESASQEEAAPPVRDMTAEWRELAEAHPEVVGRELPEDIYQACMTSDLPPLRVYETMMLSRQAEEIENLKKEIATLRQNAETAARAPVTAVSGGGAFAEPEDPFVKAFRAY